MFMGTGKSKVTADLIANREHQKNLIVCPKRVINVWPKQFDEHCAADVNVVPLIKGTAVQKAKILQEYKGPYPVVFITNYDMMWREPFASQILRFGFDLTAMDEGHRIKKPGGKASRFAHKLGKITPWKLDLTGTPMAHSPLDIYGQYRYLDQSIFGTNFEKFRSEYARMGGYQMREVVEWINQEKLAEKMYSIAINIPEDVLDLPDVLEQTYYVDLPPAMMKMYKKLEKTRVLDTGEGIVTASNSLVKQMRLQQLTSGFIKTDDKNMVMLDNSKQSMFYDILDDIHPLEPIVVFARFHEDLDRIEAVCKLQGRRYAEVSGRKDQLKAWQGGEFDVVGVQIQSGSEGEDYTRSRYGIYYSHAPSLKDFKQSKSRIKRPGQKRSMFYIYLVARGTVDVSIMEALKTNQEVIDYIDSIWARGGSTTDREEVNYE